MQRTPRGTAMPPFNPDAAFFFDIDGTLVDIADTPSGVHVDANLKRLLVALVRATGGAVAFISGRSIADVDRLFPGLRLPVAGQHGVERRTAAGDIVAPPRPSPTFIAVREHMRAIATRHPGVLFEDKGASLALHYRRAPALAGYVHREMRVQERRLRATMVLQKGKRVAELRPAGVNKGHAIQQYLNEKPFRGRVPVFIGDDVTDEQGFEAVNRLNGVSIKVGRGKTAATWRLADVAAVRAWLRMGLHEIVPEPSRGTDDRS